MSGSPSRPQRRIDRRQFLTSAASLAATATAAAYFPWAASAFANLSPNDRPRIGCIGVGGMGRGDAHDHKHFGDILAICDVDKEHADKVNAEEQVASGKADVYGDYRKVLERSDIDVVSVVTPDHWHVKIAIEALQAGKHVFCQKPLTLTLEENQLIRNACRKYADRVFFVGTQQRSDRDLFLRAVNMVRKGFIGDVQKITVGINGGDVGGPFKQSDPPPQLDWNMWLGQAPKVDYIEQRCHNNFRWWYEYSGGKMTDWGAHHVDVAAWAFNLSDTGPVKVEPVMSKHPVVMKNGMPTDPTQYNAATNFHVTATFANGAVLHIRDDAQELGFDNGLMLEGTDGRIFVNRGKLTGAAVDSMKDNPLKEETLTTLYKGKQPGNHMKNFFECMTDRTQPISDVHSHHRAMTVCHLANIAIRLDRTILWNPETEQIVGDNDAALFAAREQRKGYEIQV